MSINVDEAEHSMEMELPYIRAIFAGREDVKIVPIMIGALSTDSEAQYGEGRGRACLGVLWMVDSSRTDHVDLSAGKILAGYLDDPSNLFVVSSDFCHWCVRGQSETVLESGYTSLRFALSQWCSEPMLVALLARRTGGDGSITCPSQESPRSSEPSRRWTERGWPSSSSRTPLRSPPTSAGPTTQSAGGTRSACSSTPCSTARRSSQ